MDFYEELPLRSNRAADESKLVRDALVNNKVVKMVPGWHIPDLRSFYDELIEDLGEVMTIGEDFKQGGVQTGERWMEIRYDHDIPDLSAYRHSKNAQPLHTDESYISSPGDVMFFYCINQAERGGATTFVDGNELVTYLTEYHPDLLQRLISTDVSYKKAGEERTAKILDLSDPKLPRFNFNYYCINPDESKDNKTLNKEFFDVLQSEVAYTYMAMKVNLNPGEAVAWWDEYVLHGREAFKASKTNDRFIWKAGLKWK